MNYFLFVTYYLLLIWLICSTPFFKKLEVTAPVLVGLFTIKVAAGMYYGWFFTKMPHYQQQADTWRMYYESQEETRWLKRDVAGFLADLFRPRYATDTNVLATQNSYWNDIKSVLVVKLMALLNLLSGGRYYINVLFFAYITFWGPAALSRLSLYYFPQKKVLIIAGAFLVPSTLLWCSGFHKEGLLLSCLGGAAWLVHAVFIMRKTKWSSVLLLLTALMVSFLLRNFLTLFFVLWCLPWIAACYFPKYRLLWFGATVLFSLTLFIASAYLSFLPNLPYHLALRQQEFLELSGESLLQSRPLEPEIGGYIKAFPSAIVNGFLQPLPHTVKKASYVPAALEILLFLLVTGTVLYSIIKKKAVRFIEPSTNGGKALLLFCFCFSASVFLLTGFTIPFLGAIVRYKSVVWPFLIVPLFVLLPSSLLQVLQKNKWKLQGSKRGVG